MLEQHELVKRVLELFHKVGVLEKILIIGSWPVHFYRHHYREADFMDFLRTRDIDLDVNFLRRAVNFVNIPNLLDELGFRIEFNSGDGSMRLIHAQLLIDFLVPEIGRGSDEPCKIKGFGIVAQPLRYLSPLEDDILTVDYYGLSVKVPNPVMFAVHKLLISEKRKSGEEKRIRDLRQAFEVLELICRIGEESRFKSIRQKLPPKQKKSVKQALEYGMASSQIRMLPDYVVAALSLTE